jgi:hypothetical protein
MAMSFEDMSSERFQEAVLDCLNKPERQMPQRIQRQRTKGWRMPEGTLYVGRNTRWGNPLLPQMWGLQRTIDVYRDMVLGIWNPDHFSDCDDQDYAIVYQLVSNWKDRIDGHPLEAARFELRGHNLACWCPLDQPCHADVLLALANAT